MKPETFVLDVDGVLTTGQILYSQAGKAYKIFGPDDHDVLNVIRDKLKVVFITADRRGYPISKKRIVDEMRFDLHLVHHAKRLEWFKENLDLSKTIYMGDGAFDVHVFKEVGYSICPSNGFYKTREAANYVTQHGGGDRAVAEAGIHILEKFFSETRLVDNSTYGVWGNSDNSNKTGVEIKN